jgi:hypothetical protein
MPSILGVRIRGVSSTSERYGSRPPWLRALGVGLAGVVAVAGLVWLAWVVWFHATPSVSSELVTWQVVDDHTVTARVQEKLEDGHSSNGVHCLVQATALDHTTVGEVTFTPRNGTNDVTIRTERPATSVAFEGCTAPGQNRPR